MAIFDYTLPSGDQFRLEAPAGTTQAQADKIFYEQVAAGAFIGYEPGQTLTSAETKLVKFELSRLDRGTAGVDSSPILTVNQSIDIEGVVINFTSRGLSFPPGARRVSFGAGGLFSGAGGLSETSGSGSELFNNPDEILAPILDLPVPERTPNLEDVPLSDPIDEADVVDVKGDDFSPIPVVGSNGVRALTDYQTQKIMAQIAKLVNQESDQITLEKGIGRYGFTAYALEQSGYVKPGTTLKYFSSSNANFVAVMSSPSVWTGRDGVYSLDALLNDPLLQNRVQNRLMQQSYDNLVANGIIITTPQTSIRISTGQVYTSSGLQSTQNLTTIGLLNTSLSSLTPEARTALLNSPAIKRLISATAINLNTISSGAANSLTAGVTNLPNLPNAVTALTNQITGSVGALVANASKFGTQAAALWSQGNLQGINLTSVKSTLTNLVPPNLSGLTSGLNAFGKASSFATNFANPLGGLNNVGSLFTPGGGIGGALTGQLGGLQSQIAGQLGSLTNIGSLSAVFGGGGDLVSGTSVAAGFNNTVNRSTVDAAFARVVGSAKVPLPIFQYPSLTALSPRLDIQQAQNFLKNLQTQGQAVAGQVQSAAGRLLG